jgi:very-short-patch-repair endonuclease
MTASEIWEKDAEKEKLAIREGFNFLTIWESEYRKNKKIIFRKIIQKNGRKCIKHVWSGFTNR